MSESELPARKLPGQTDDDARDWIVRQYLDLMRDMDRWGGQPKNLDPLTDLWGEDVGRRMEVAGVNTREDWDGAVWNGFVKGLSGG